MRARSRLFTLTLLLAAGSVGLIGAGSSDSDDSDKKDDATAFFDAGMTLAKAGSFDAARKKFEAANKARKNDPDILNMLAYTQRKTDRLDEAFETYARALDKRSKFPQAREYLGEAHLQAALEQVGVLRSYGDEGAEHAESLIAAFHAAIEAIESGEATLPEANGYKW